MRIKIFLDKIKSFFEYVTNSFIAEKDNYVLWLSVFFVVGILLGFCDSSFNFYHPILLIEIFLLLLFILNKKLYCLRLINISLIFVLLGYIRTYYFINNHNYNMIDYPLGEVKIYGKIEKEIINKKYKGGYSRDIVVKIYKIKRNNKEIKNIPSKLQIKLKNYKEKIYISDVILTAKVFPVEDKYFSSSFDNKRFMYFKGIGGIGYGGTIIYNDKNENANIKEKVDTLRTKIANRIINVRKNSKSTSIIAVLLTGQKTMADKEAVEYMNYSGLSHLLSISGLHMMTLIYMIMFIVKWLLLRFEYFATHCNVFKISAIVSLVINFIYLLLSGLSVSAIRAYIMSVVLLLSIVLGKFNTSIRSVMFVMFIMTFAKPYIVFNAGFQMSFMAVIGLTSCIEYYYNYKNNNTKTIFSEYFNGKIWQYLLLGFITSLVAECATTPFSIYHFNNYSFYNIFANSFLTPLVSFIVLPAGLFSLLLYIFHLDWLVILPVSYVMDLILYISKIITKLPKAVIFIQSPSPFAMFFMIFGFLWFCLWKEKWRKFGIFLYVLGLILVLSQRKIDVVVDAVDKIIVFRDDKISYVYNLNSHNKYKLTKILKKLTVTDYKSIDDTEQTDCDKQHCIKIINNNDKLTFIKNGGVVKINLQNYNVLENFNLKIHEIYRDGKNTKFKTYE